MSRKKEIKEDSVDWCQRNHATVWFGQQEVSVKVSEFPGTTKGATLQEAIAGIELKRQERQDIRAALASLAKIERE
jgi:hypothetical protein